MTQRHLALMTVWQISNSPILLGLLLGHNRGSAVVIIKNSATAQTKRIATGWNWWLFLAPVLYGIPLFYKRLYWLGSLFFIAGLACVCLEAMSLYNNTGLSLSVQNLMFIICLLFIFILFACQFWLGKKGNEIILKSYMKKGWLPFKPDNTLANES